MSIHGERNMKGKPRDITGDGKLKIGLIGTHEVGKTTLGHILTGYLKAMDYKTNLVHEAARLSPFGLLGETTMKTEMWIANQQINNELTTAEFSDIIICDRTSLDLLSYAKYVVEKSPTKENKEAYELLDKIVDANLKSYDLFVYFPITEKLVSKRSKKHDDTFKNQIDANLVKIIKQKKLNNVHELESESIHGRVEEIIDICCLDKDAFKVVTSTEKGLYHLKSAKKHINSKLEGKTCISTNQ